MTIKLTIAYITLLTIIFLSCSQQAYIDYEIKTITHKKTISGQDDVTVSLKCTYPDFKSKGTFWTLVNQAVEETMRKDFMEPDILDSFDSLWDRINSEHTQISIEMPDFIQSWSLDRSADVVYHKANLLSIRFNEYLYTGGAHPNTNVQFLNYDIEKQIELTRDDIFIKESNKELLKIAESQFRKLREIPESQSLNEQGYFFENDTFKLSKTFTIQENGILFYYNPYEIAPYAAGPSELLLTYDTLKSIINPNGSLSSLL